ncbi:DUF2155 domain-containing protein [Glycocaulis sp.]|uniref:DUF2155 domain-containing protein n=1 Tax=Glycocaulis sp. TaxID=1969725 RepID=UPI003D200448
MTLLIRLLPICAFALASLLLASAALAQEGDEPGSLEEWAEDIEEPDSDLTAPLEQQQEQRATRRADELSSRPGTIAVLRGLDKVTARTRDFEVNVGDSYTFGALDITVRYCRRRPPEEPPEVFVFLEINDQRTDGFGIGAEGERLFSGWMFASNPALNALDHPVYDVWVIDCRS